jgi:hypothetical protein
MPSKNRPLRKPEFTPDATLRLHDRVLNAQNEGIKVLVNGKLVNAVQKRQLGAKPKRADKKKKPGDHDTKTGKLDS